MFKNFYGCLYEGNLITVAHVVDNSGKIALSKPELRDKITEELLNVEKIPVPTKECRDILVGKTIEAFQVYHNKIKDKNKVLSFVKRQLYNPRNSTKAKAEKFLRRFEIDEQKCALNPENLNRDLDLTPTPTRTARNS